MADETYQPLVYRKQGSTEFVVASSGVLTVEDGGVIEVESGGQIDIASGGHIDLESGGYLSIADGGYIDLGSVSTEVADAALDPFGVHYLDGSSSGLYTLPDPHPGSYVLLFTPGLTTGKEAEIASTAAQFTRPNSTGSTGLLFGSSDSTGANSAQFAFLVGLTTGLWHVVAKTTGCAYL